MKGIAVFNGFTFLEHDYSEGFDLSPLENLWSSNTKNSLEKNPLKHILASDMTMRQLYALKYVSVTTWQAFPQP